MPVPSHRSTPDTAKDRLTSAYIKDVKRFPTIPKPQERILLSRIQDGDRNALNALVRANLKFVISVAYNYRNRGLPLPDLINEGNIGLIKAARRFDIAKDFRFISYAVWWIRQGILHALSNQPGFLNVSAGRMNNVLTLRKLEAALTQKLGRHPRLDELKAETRYSANILRFLYREEAGAASTLGREGGGSDSREFLELRDESQTPDQAADHYLACKEVEGVLGRLDDREREILKLHYGFETDTPLDMAEIAGRIGLSRERVRQIKKKALAKLQRAALAIRSYAKVRGSTGNFQAAGALI